VPPTRRLATHSLLALRRVRLHTDLFYLGGAQEHENRMRPLLALRDTLGSRGTAGDEQPNTLAVAKKKTEAAVQMARAAAVQEAQTEQDQMKQAHSRKEKQL
jgi:hypothetical protein